MNVMLQRGAARRIISDVVDIRRNPLTDQGIYYKHDDDCMVRGYVMIVGPTDTPYANGYFLFDVLFPNDYPSSPPKIKFMTQDPHSNIRFNPNLYRNGKVCVSTLNTWHGEQWSGCQTLSSVLLTLCTLFVKNPLLNEPGIRLAHQDVIPYSNIISYKTISVAIHGMVSGTTLPNEKFRDLFHEDMIILYEKNKESIYTQIVDLEKHIGVECETQKCGIYQMKCVYDFDSLRGFRFGAAPVSSDAMGS